VETHLAHVFQKLNIRGRSELPRELQAARPQVLPLRPAVPIKLGRHGQAPQRRDGVTEVRGQHETR
jgi:hypothetical protein